MTTDEQRERAREKVAEKIARIAGVDYYRLPEEYKQRNLNAADTILSLKWPNGQPMVVIADQDQTLPENPYLGNPRQLSEWRGFSQCKQAMAGWIRPLKPEKEG